MDGDYSHEIKRYLFLGRKAMTNLNSVLKGKDITLPPKGVGPHHPPSLAVPKGPKVEGPGWGGTSAARREWATSAGQRGKEGRVAGGPAATRVRASARALRGRGRPAGAFCTRSRSKSLVPLASLSPHVPLSPLLQIPPSLLMISQCRSREKPGETALSTPLAPPSRPPPFLL